MSKFKEGDVVRWTYQIEDGDESISENESSFWPHIGSVATVAAIHADGEYLYLEGFGEKRILEAKLEDELKTAGLWVIPATWFEHANESIPSELIPKTTPPSVEGSPIKPSKKAKWKTSKLDSKKMTEPQNFDAVSKPRHYTTHPSGVECIDVIRGMYYNTGNAAKYLWRFEQKGGLEDLRKSKWYLLDVINAGDTLNDKWQKHPKQKLILSHMSYNIGTALRLIFEYECGDVELTDVTPCDKLAEAVDLINAEIKIREHRDLMEGKDADDF